MPLPGILTMLAVLKDRSQVQAVFLVLIFQLHLIPARRRDEVPQTRGRCTPVFILIQPFGLVVCHLLLGGLSPLARSCPGPTE